MSNLAWAFLIAKLKSSAITNTVLSCGLSVTVAASCTGNCWLYCPTWLNAREIWSAMQSDPWVYWFYWALTICSCAGDATFCPHPRGRSTRMLQLLNLSACMWTMEDGESDNDPWTKWAVLIGHRRWLGFLFIHSVSFLKDWTEHFPNTLTNAKDKVCWSPLPTGCNSDHTFNEPAPFHALSHSKFMLCWISTTTLEPVGVNALKNTISGLCSMSKVYIPCSLMGDVVFGCLRGNKTKHVQNCLQALGRSLYYREYFNLLKTCIILLLNDCWKASQLHTRLHEIRTH